MPRLLLGLDVGGTKSAAVVGDTQGTVFHRASGLTPPGPWPDAVAFLIGLVRNVCAQARIAPAHADALGVSCGGPLDSRTGTVYAPPNLPGWDAVPLRRLLTEEFGLPVVLENDANATALAEHRWGAGVGCRDMAFLTMGTGIGGGLILDGTLYRGRRDLAGEIGHAIVWPGGPPCLCGKRGCLEALASGTAIARIGRERYDDPNVTAPAVCDLARSGDSVACGIVAETRIGWASVWRTCCTLSTWNGLFWGRWPFMPRIFCWNPSERRLRATAGPVFGKASPSSPPHWATRLRTKPPSPLRSHPKLTLDS